MGLRDLQNALSDLPDGLDGTYSRILARVDARNQEKAIAMLQLLVWAKRELTLDELVDALAIRRDGERLHYDPANKMPVPNEIVKILPGLIILDAVKRWSYGPVRILVRLAHLSVKEYLTSDSVLEKFKPSLVRLNAHIAIVDMCFACFYSRYPEPSVLRDLNLEDLEYSQGVRGDMSHLPYFVSYLPNWPHHARIAQADASASDRIIQLLTSGLAPGSPFIKCTMLSRTSLDNKVEYTSALFYASMCGLDRVVSRLLEHGTQTIDNFCNDNLYDDSLYISKRFNYFGLTPLEAATRNCHKETVRILLANGATPTMDTVPKANKDSPGETETALRILAMLLDHGANPTYAAVQSAMELGNISLAQFMLDNGVPGTPRLFD